jgi:V8-like Glu-specific endopeptidase
MRTMQTLLATALIVISTTSASIAKSKRGFEFIPEPHATSSPVFDGPAETDAGRVELTPAHVQTVRALNTPWVRVHLADYHLGENSYLILTATNDGDWQRLDAWSLPFWQNTSAIFSGSEVTIQLFVSAGDEGVFFTVDELLVADPEDLALGFDAQPVPIDEKSICGSGDDRAASSDSRVGRLFMGGCTGWLVHTGAALTAGHCGTGSIGGVLEFNVPASTSNGVPRPAPVNDQYPVTGVRSWQSNGEGQDYAVFSVGPNSNTELRPHIAGGFFHMTSLVPSVGTTLRVTGYGVDPFPAGTGGAGASCCDWDNDDDCDYNCNSTSYTLQTDTGSCDDCLVGSAIEHTVDTTPANSGSPIIWNSANMAIAIHTQGGCDSFFSDYDNAGTWLGYNPLENALNDFLGVNVVWVDAASSTPIQVGGALTAFDTVAEGVNAAPSGFTVAIVEGSYPHAEGNAFTVSKPLTLTAPVGTVVIGN